MDRDFVERRDESFYLVGSRVPLACIVREFQDGQSPEAIRSAFPTLTLEQVYGAITFYLGHRAEVDEDIATREREENAFSESRSRRILEGEAAARAAPSFTARGDGYPTSESRLNGFRARRRPHEVETIAIGRGHS